jgi:hypothetical protein
MNRARRQERLEVRRQVAPIPDPVHPFVEMDGTLKEHYAESARWL